MTIDLYTNTSADNVVSKNITLVVQLTGTLRDGCEIENPTFIISGEIANLLNSNYFYIPEFDRYYYMIKKPKILRTDLYEITGKVDVLMSNAATIKAQGAIITKQTYKNNTLLNDGSFKVYQNTETVTKLFPNGFSGTTYVLMIAGG